MWSFNEDKFLSRINAKSVVSGIFGGGGAAEEAAQVQAGATQAGIAEQRRQFDIAQAQAAPFRQAGLSALQQQLALLGLPGLQPQQFAQPVAAPAPAIQQFGGRRDPRIPAAAARRAKDLGVFGGLLSGVGAAVRGGAGAPVAGGVQIPEAVSREQALAAFAETPGQQFLRERQEKALLRSAGAIGGLGGGNIRTALQEQAFGRATTQFGEFQNRLAGLTGGAQTATAGLTQLGGQTAGQISGLLQAGGQAQASGILGAQQAGAALGGQVLGAGLGAAAGGGLFGAGAATAFGGGAGAGALLGLLSDIRLKENIVKIGELPSGLNLYRWDWTKEGKKLAVNQIPVGVIAQEAQKLFPEAVTESDGFLRVDYKRLH